MAFVLTEKKDHYAILTLNRPEALNALNTEVLAEMSQAFDELQRDDEVRVIVITGAGRAFAAGADIGEMADLNMIEGRKFGNVGQKLYRTIEKSEKPTIAAVNGYALGGGLELAMCCDIRIASEKAVLGSRKQDSASLPDFPELRGSRLLSVRAERQK